MFTRALVRPPAQNFSAGLTTSTLGPPNYELALRQHELYCHALTQCGLEVIRLEADERYPDSTFVEDTAVIIAPNPNARPKIMFTRPGAASRTGEVESIRKSLGQFDFEMHSIEPPGTLDGGDVCEADNHFFIGISERTNESGAKQLARLLDSWGQTSSFVDIRNLERLLHLKSGLAYLGNQRLALVETLANNEMFRGYEIVGLCPEEEYAANCIRVNEHLLIAAQHPRFQQSLTDLGYQTVALQMSEFQKMDGGISCLSLRF